MNNLDDKNDMLTKAEVLRLLPFRASYFWLVERAKDGDKERFPKPIQVSPKKFYYDRTAVADWIAQKNFPKKATHAPAAAPRPRAKV